MKGRTERSDGFICEQCNQNAYIRKTKEKIITPENEVFEMEGWYCMFCGVFWYE